MKGLYLVLLLAGNLFSQTTQPDTVYSAVFSSEYTESSTIDVTNLTAVTTGSGIVLTIVDFQDCKGDDLMFNYISGQIQEVNMANFGDRQASYYLIQAPEVLEAYQWMRKNRGHKYTIHQMVVRVNRWYEG